MHEKLTMTTICDGAVQEKVDMEALYGEEEDDGTDERGDVIDFRRAQGQS